MSFWVLVYYILKRGLLNSVNLQESRVDLTPFSHILGTLSAQLLVPGDKLIERLSFTHFVEPVIA